MKEAMQAHVETARHSMFQDATNKVKGDLNSMCQEIQQAMAVHIDGVAEKLERDYMGVMVGADAQAVHGITWAGRTLRSEMLQPLSEADSWFAALFPAQEVAPEDAPAHTPQLQPDGELGGLITQQLEESHEPSEASSVALEAEPNF